MRVAHGICHLRACWAVLLLRCWFRGKSGKRDDSTSMYGEDEDSDVL